MDFRSVEIGHPSKQELPKMTNKGPDHNKRTVSLLSAAALAESAIRTQTQSQWRRRGGVLRRHR